jgi:hypothetical protein
MTDRWTVYTCHVVLTLLKCVSKKMFVAWYNNGDNAVHVSGLCRHSLSDCVLQKQSYEVMYMTIEHDKFYSLTETNVQIVATYVQIVYWSKHDSK